VAQDHFDERMAAVYDVTSAHRFDPAVLGPAVDFLVPLAAAGAALELGVGTGRVALPLSQRGIPVHGIDLSPAMLAQLRAKPGGQGIEVTLGDFAATRLPGAFQLAYLVYNTLSNLTTQDEQVRCFQNVAAHLVPGGFFVVELLVPPLQRLPVGETYQAFRVTPTHLGFDEIDVVTQRMVSHHYLVVDGKLETFSLPFRFAWPSELDLMARLAGLRLHERWASWTRAPFTCHSTAHVSVWQKT
jgi:SAM-dependent methyltransferase